MQSKRCRIHYRKLRRDNGQFPDQTLSDKIVEALKTRKSETAIGDSVSNRITDAPRAEGYKRFINDLHIDENYIFGNICLFSPGEMQALIQSSQNSQHTSLDEAMKAWSIAEAKAPDGHEYLHAISYWLVIGDHLYQIQHSSLQAKALEEYFTWLLKDQAQSIEHNQYVELQAVFDKDQIGGDLDDVKSVEIGGFIPETIQKADLNPKNEDKVIEYETHEKLADKVSSSFGKAKKILSDLLGELEMNKLLESIPSEAALEVTVNIGYRATKRKINKEFMGNLAAGLRNTPDGELRVRGKDGEIKGDDARLSSMMPIRKMSHTSSLLDLEHALEQMLEVHRRFLHDGKISESDSF